MRKYYLGLDLGTSTVGWAVTDEKYALIRKKGKDLWGVREFEEANTSEERRNHRISRRRRQRQQLRVGMLKTYFDDAIKDVDPNFYVRLENSKYHLEDKEESVRTPNGIFCDKNYTDKKYFEEYPTIFHLRKELIHNPEPHDVRLVFLAILNMYKHRGHFLNPGVSSGESAKIQEALLHFNELVGERLELSFASVDADKYERILGDRNCSRSIKAEKLCSLLGIDKKQKRETAIIKTICGLKGDAKTIFDLELEEKISIEFSSFGYDDKEPEIQAALGDEYFEIILAMKSIYNIGALSSILKGFDYLSDARVSDFEKHKHDLEVLKRVIREQAEPKVYAEMFRSENPGSYSAYVNSVSFDKMYTQSEKSKHRRNMKGRSREDFYKAVKNVLKNMTESEDVVYIKTELELENFMPKQLTASNGVIPYQVHEKELKAILKNAEGYLPFLKEIDESGLTVSERILKLFSFQVPYYIGPTTTRSAEACGNGWVVRKENGAVLPWNIEEKIDLKQTSEEFISRMVRRCTYINGEQVMPKCSLIYERYCVLNEINNISIDGERISVALKQDIYNDLFTRGKKVSRKTLVNYLKQRGLIVSDEQISGIDVTINSALGSYGKFKSIFGEELDTDYGRKKAEDIIFWCTIYGDSKAFLIQNIRDNYPEVSDADVKRIAGIKFKDWGRFSKAFLQMQGVNKSTGEMMSIMTALWETEFNLMELLYSDAFTFKEAIQEKQKSAFASLTEISHDALDDYYFSAPVKKMIWQTLSVVKEISTVMCNEPERIFIEMTRSEEEKGDKGRKNSRKKDLIELYKNIKDDTHNWKKLIEDSDESGLLRSKKMYLYLTQMGRDMYSGDAIDLDDLFNNNLYDIDHIYPRHFVKDDSIHNNLVLVRKESNAHKSDVYPLETGIRNNSAVKDLWHLLRMKNLISEEKYRRLTGTKAFTEEQKADFIARQLVETGQATKGVADLLKQALPQTEIVYAKAGNVSDFRKKYNLLKSRAVNDFHHANDAYLNIVVGNVYLTKFTHNPKNFIQKDYASGMNYHLTNMFKWDVKRNGYCAWKAATDEDAGTIAVVKQMMRKNTPIITRKSFTGHGGIADQTLYGHRKAKKDGYIPLKASDKKMQDVQKYGGFSSVSTAYFFLVEHEVKGKIVRTIETLPVIFADRVEKNPKILEQYCEQILGLQNYSVRMRKIGIQSLIKLNGYFVQITGKTGNQLILRNAVSLCFSQRWINYIKMIEKYINEKYLSKSISNEMNIELYQELISKHKHGIFNKRPNAIGDKLESGVKKFVKLSIEEQTRTLYEILKLTMLGTLTADLTAIGGSANSGKMLMSKEISKNDEVLLINQSVTGLFEQKIDLLKI